MNVPIKADLNGRIAVVTGGAGVLCREFCKALAACGARVAVLNRTSSKAEQLVEEIKADGGDAIAVQVDVMDKESVRKAHEAFLAA